MCWTLASPLLFQVMIKHQVTISGPKNGGVYFARFTLQGQSHSTYGLVKYYDAHYSGSIHGGGNSLQALCSQSIPKIF